MKVVKFIVFLPLGLLLYLFSPGFRNTVNAKGRGPDEEIATGEDVVAVLAGSQNKTIGGKR